VTLVETVLNKTPLVVKRTLDIGLEFAIENPAELGTDLIATAVAGYNRCRSNCIVVDFGTALSFTVVDQARRIRGASIAPGMQAAMNALSRNTDQLPHVPLVAPPSAIGTNTIHAIQSGIIFGYVGLVGAIIDRIRGELDGPATVIATGGLSGVIATLIDSVDSVEPWLTLEGLRLIGERNPERA
jgi:type III pantothenate kinase